MNLRRLVSTYEVLGARCGPDRDMQFDLRIEIFRSTAGEFTCRVWIIEEFRIVPTNGDYNNLDINDREFYADKVLGVLMDAHGFEDIRGDSEEAVRETVLAKIGELFDLSAQRRA